MGKHRVYEIAKELGKTNQEVIDILAKNNIQVKSTLSTVDDTVRDLVVKNSARKPVQEKKAAPAPQHIVKKEPVKQAEDAPKQVQTQQNSAANTQRPQQQQQGQRPNNQGQRPINQGPRPAAVNHQQGQNAGQNRPNQASASRIVLTTNKVSAHSNSRGNVLIPKIKVRGLIKTVLTRALIRKIVPIINRDNARSRETDRSSVLRGAFI